MPTATFTIEKECRHVRRYSCDDEEFPLDTAYVKREWSDGKDKIEVTVEASEKN
jgi:hypothetical protein